MNDPDLADLLADLTDDELWELAEQLPAEMAIALAESLTTTDVAAIPDSPLGQAQALDPMFIIRDHLAYLAQRITDALEAVERGESRYIAVTMPPRMGKTTMICIYLIIWTLRKHPEWPVMLTSHDPVLATSWGRQIRRLITKHPDLGISIAPDAGAASEWETTAGGTVVSRSLGGSIVGKGAKILAIDDPHKGLAEAHSEVARNRVWNWWLGDAYTRLDRGGHLVLVVMCMTGDTPVLLGDGTERPLRDIRPGDEVATYEDGQLTTATVRNWANQGPDTIYSVRMKSGATVRANARHPFLVIDESGAETWRPLRDLRPGDEIVRAMRPEAPTSESPAPPMAAMPPRSARACACPTTAPPAGPQATGLRRLTRRLGGVFVSWAATGSPRRSMTDSSQSRADGAPSAGGYPEMSAGRSTGPRCSASITTTRPEPCEDCFATTATSSSDGHALPTSSAPPLPTWSITRDEVLEVRDAGAEDVFDIQVERTENFIANGLTAHNTRWHEDDLIGRLTSREHEGDPNDWEIIRFPAVAEEADVLGRKPGEPLLSPQVPTETPVQALETWEKIKTSVGSYVWAANYQGAPAPAKGQIFDVSWFRYWTTNEANVTDDGTVVYLNPLAPSPEGQQQGRWLDSWDMAFKGKDDSDYVVAGRWLLRGANRYLIQLHRERMTFTRTLAKMREWGSRDGTGAHVHRRLVEDKANGTAVIDTLKDEIPGIVPVNPTDSKTARARAVTPEVESRNVLLPYLGDPGNEWVPDYLAEFRSFPTGAHDDQVDMTTQALKDLRGPSGGAITVPGRSGRQVTRDYRQQLNRPRRTG